MNLENINISYKTRKIKNFYMPVQWVNRPNQNFRGYSGRIVTGSVKPGDKVIILPSGQKSQVDRIVTYDGDLEEAVSDQSITLTLSNEVDCSRGQIIVSENSPLELADQFEITLIWMDENSLIPDRQYYLKIGAETPLASVTELKCKINVNTMEKIIAKTLNIHDIGITNVTIDRSIPFTNYKDNHSLGGFVLINKITNATVGAGLINFAGIDSPYEIPKNPEIHIKTNDLTVDQAAEKILSKIK